jgi:hypothetical protein
VEEQDTPRRFRVTSDQFSGLILLAVGVGVGLANRAYPVGSLQDPGPGYLPLMLSVFLGAIGLVIALAGARATPLSGLTWPEAPRAAIILAACGFATLALETLGYRLTVFTLLVFFLGVMERRKPGMIAAVALGFSVASYYLIGTLLRVQLPRGPWGL